MNNRIDSDMADLGMYLSEEGMSACCNYNPLLNRLEVAKIGPNFGQVDPTKSVGRSFGDVILVLR